MNLFQNFCSPEYEVVDQKYETSWNESCSAYMADLLFVFPKVVANVKTRQYSFFFFSLSASFLFW